MKQHDDLDSWKTSRRSPVQAARSQIVSRVVCGKVPPPTLGKSPVQRPFRQSAGMAHIFALSDYRAFIARRVSGGLGG